jgi:hypothetical protein
VAVHCRWTHFWSFDRVGGLDARAVAFFEGENMRIDLYIMDTNMILFICIFFFIFHDLVILVFHAFLLSTSSCFLQFSFSQPEM